MFYYWDKESSRGPLQLFVSNAYPWELSVCFRLHPTTRICHLGTWSFFFPLSSVENKTVRMWLAQGLKSTGAFLNGWLDTCSNVIPAQSLAACGLPSVWHLQCLLIFPTVWSRTAHSVSWPMVNAIEHSVFASLCHFCIPCQSDSCFSSPLLGLELQA